VLSDGLWLLELTTLETARLAVSLNFLIELFQAGDVMGAMSSSGGLPSIAGRAVFIVGLTAPSAMAAAPLGAVPEWSGFVSVWRVVFIAAVSLVLMVFCQWVDKDTDFVRRINKTLWNSVVLGGAGLGLLLWLFLPWQSTALFALGFGLCFVLAVSTDTSYVVVRNGMVDASKRVFTPTHIKTWMAQRGKKKEGPSAVFERVRLTGPEGKVEPPADPALVGPYEAAQNLLFDALWRRATEVELLVAPNASRLAYRIDGVVAPRHDLLSREEADQSLTFIKQASGLDVNEHRRPQESRISASIDVAGRGMSDIEVRTSGTTQHERLSLRVVSDEARLRLRDLGMTERVRTQLEEVLEESGGLFLVSGPRSCGLTTTQYALLRSHDAFMNNLLSLEREPLMDLENITQHIYDPNKHEGSFSRQLQTVLRREPDVVMVSDCPDRETAHMVVKAAQGGKRLYVGIRARDSLDALKKFVSLAGDTDGVAAVLRAILAQRLVRKLCVACRIPYKPDLQLLRKANLPIEKIEHFYRSPKPEETVDDKGRPKICPNCQNSGYFGRTGLFELLAVDPKMRELIANGQPLSAIRAQARKNGMLYLQDVGLQKVMEGTTGMNEMLRALRNEGGAAPAGSRKGE